MDKEEEEEKETHSFLQIRLFFLPILVSFPHFSPDFLLRQDPLIHLVVFGFVHLDDTMRFHVSLGEKASGESGEPGPHERQKDARHGDVVAGLGQPSQFTASQDRHRPRNIPGGNLSGWAERWIMRRISD